LYYQIINNTSLILHIQGIFLIFKKKAMNTSDLLKELTKIAITAGDAIMEIYNDESRFNFVYTKPDNSPLTLADSASHQLILDELQEISDDPIISEEGKDIPYEKRKDWKRFWLVDPLDGTKEFIKRNGEFTVNIALIEHGLPVLGVIYAPAINVLYHGVKDYGSFKRENGTDTKIFVNTASEKLTAVGSRTHTCEEEESFLSNYPITNYMASGSSLKFCLVAEGSTDIYYRHNPTMEWDTAAGQAIVEAAGGKVFDKNYNQFTYNKQSLKNEQFLCIGDPAVLSIKLR
jgi:3'(2'), 5'-bisphosphate nucleotidase